MRVEMTILFDTNYTDFIVGNGFFFKTALTNGTYFRNYKQLINEKRIKNIFK